MPRAKRTKPYHPTGAHDRRAHDLPYNAEVMAVEIDDPLAIEPGEKIVALRSVRSDPLGRLHSHRQIDDAQFRGGRAFQSDWERAERGPRAVDPTREYVDGGERREPITDAQRRAVMRLTRAERELVADGSVLVHEVLILGLTREQGRPTARGAQPELERLFHPPLQGMSGPAGAHLRRRIPFPSKTSSAESEWLHHVVGRLRQGDGIVYGQCSERRSPRQTCAD
jgi:hypothetical protein